MNLVVLTVAFVTAPLCEVVPYSFDTASAHCLAIDPDNDGRGDICVLDGKTVRYFPRAAFEPESTWALGENPGPFDVADTDGDGKSEAVWVDGTRVLRRGFLPGEQEELLFEVPQLPAWSGPAFPQVLLVRNAGAPRVALPITGGLQLFALDGTPSKVEADEAPTATLGRPFHAWPVYPPQTGPEDALEFHLTYLVAVQPRWSGLEYLFNRDTVNARRGTPRQAQDAAAEPPENWPWMALSRESEEERLLYARAGDGIGETLVRVRRRGEDSAADEPLVVGPERSYPGRLVISDGTPPDFNGDGFTDLLLWNASEPAPTVNSLARAATQGTWALSLTIHLFNDRTSRFSPQAHSRISVEVPVSWMIEAWPLRLDVFGDMNGDGKTDLAFATSPDTYRIWLCGSAGMSEAASFEHRFEESLQGIAFLSPWTPSGKQCLALRGETSFYVLRPN